MRPSMDRVDPVENVDVGTESGVRREMNGIQSEAPKKRATTTRYVAVYFQRILEQFQTYEDGTTRLNGLCQIVPSSMFKITRATYSYNSTTAYYLNGTIATAATLAHRLGHDGIELIRKILAKDKSNKSDASTRVDRLMITNITVGHLEGDQQDLGPFSYSPSSLIGRNGRVCFTVIRDALQYVFDYLDCGQWNASIHKDRERMFQCRDAIVYALVLARGPLSKNEIVDSIIHTFGENSFKSNSISKTVSILIQKRLIKRSKQNGEGFHAIYRLRHGLVSLIDQSLNSGTGLKYAVVNACIERVAQAQSDVDHEYSPVQSDEEAEIPQESSHSFSSTLRAIKRRALDAQHMTTSEYNGKVTPHQRDKRMPLNGMDDVVSDMSMEDEVNLTESHALMDEDNREDEMGEEMEEEGVVVHREFHVGDDNHGFEDVDVLGVRGPKKRRLDINEKQSPRKIMQGTKSNSRLDSSIASTSTLSTGRTPASGASKKTDMLTREENEDVDDHEEQNAMMEDSSDDRNDTIPMDDTHNHTSGVNNSIRRSGRQPKKRKSTPFMASKIAGSRRLTKKDTSTLSRATLDDPLRLGHFEGVKLFEKPGEFNAKYQTWATYEEALERVRTAKENVIPEVLTDRDIVAEVYEKDGEGAEKWDKLTEEKVKNGQERFEVDYIVGCTKRELGSEQFEQILMKYAEYPRSSFENKKDHEGERALLKFIYDQFRLDLIELRLLSEMGKGKFESDFPNRYLDSEDGEGEGNYITQERNLYQNRLRALQHAYNYALQKAGIDADVLIADWTNEINKDDELKRVEFIAQMIPGICIGDFLKDEKAEEIKCGPGECKSCVYLPTSKTAKKCCGVLSMQGIDKKTGKMQFLDKPADAQKNSSKESASVAPLVNGPFMKVECTSKCGCDPKKCKNRDSQVGRKYSHVIFRMPGKGWTLRTVDEIERNDSGIVGEYGGVAQLKKSTGDAKRYDLAMNSALDKKKPFTVAAAKCGNETRYISHSCVCNLHLIMAMVKRNGPWYTVPLFYPKRKIFAGEELTFDYMESIPDYDHTVFFDYCLCGYDACRYPRRKKSKTESVKANATFDEAGPSRILQTLSIDRREGEQSGASDDGIANDERYIGALYETLDDLNNGDDLGTGKPSASTGSSTSTSRTKNKAANDVIENDGGTREVKQEDEQEDRRSMLPQMSEGDASENEEDDEANAQTGAKLAELLGDAPLAGEMILTTVGTSGDNNGTVDDDHVEEMENEEITNTSVRPIDPTIPIPQPTDNNESSTPPTSSSNAANDATDAATDIVVTNIASTPIVPTENANAAARNPRSVTISKLNDAPCFSGAGTSSTDERRDDPTDEIALRASLFKEYANHIKRLMKYDERGVSLTVLEPRRDEIDEFIEKRKMHYNVKPVSVLEDRVKTLRKQ